MIIRGGAPADRRVHGRCTVAALGACLLIAVLAGCGQSPQRPTAGTQPPAAAGRPPLSAQVSASEQRVIEETNVFRHDNELLSLRPSARLIHVAQNHARNMARRDRYGDDDKNGHVLDGKTIEYRIKTGGYAFVRVSENVGYQLNRKDAVASMMEGWKHSPGHRRNMLGADVTELGVGVAQGRSGRWYFVQVFGRPADGARAMRVSN